MSPFTATQPFCHADGRPSGGHQSAPPGYQALRRTPHDRPAATPSVHALRWLPALPQRRATRILSEILPPRHFLHIFHFCGIVFTAIFVSCEGAHCLRLEILSSFHTDSTKIGRFRENKMNKTKTHHGARCHFRIPSSRDFLSTRSNFMRFGGF